MSFTIKVRTLPGSPMMAEYECDDHGRFDALVERDHAGDPPAWQPCPVRCRDGAPGAESAELWQLLCMNPAPLAISAPKVARDSVPAYAAVRGGDTERRPGMLDTRPLAEGMSTKEWRKQQDAGRQERRHQQLIARGLKTKRVQVG